MAKIEAPALKETTDRLSQSAARGAGDPAPTFLDVGAFHRRPRNAMRRLFLSRIAGMLREGVIEGLAINGLGMIGKMRLDGSGKIVVGSVWHVEPRGHAKDIYLRYALFEANQYAAA